MRRCFVSPFPRLFLGVLLGLASLLVHAETVTDVAGRSVEIPAKPERILLGEGRMLYALALLEGDQPLKRVVGWQGELSTTDTQGYAAFKAKYPEIDSIPKIGKTSEASVSPEKVLALNPDIAIFGIAGHGPGLRNGLVDELRKAGVPVVFIDFRQHPMRNTLPSMRLLGKVLHREKQAEEYIAFYQEHLQRVQERVAEIPDAQRPRVFIELLAGVGPGLTCCHTAGNGNFGEFIEAAGGDNLAADLVPGVIGDINLEHLIAVDPQVYLISGTRDMQATDQGYKAGAGVTPQAGARSLKKLTERKGINTLTAVREQRVHGIWHNFYNSPYNILAVEALAKWFYPEQFEDLDPAHSLDELNRRFLPVDLRGAYWADFKDAQ